MGETSQIYLYVSANIPFLKDVLARAYQQKGDFCEMVHAFLSINEIHCRTERTNRVFHRGRKGSTFGLVSKAT